MPPPPPRSRHPPAYSVAAQMAARLHKLGRAHSHEGVTSYYHDEDGELMEINMILLGRLKYLLFYGEGFSIYIYTTTFIFA